jgi:hypothetical protein
VTADVGVQLVIVSEIVPLPPGVRPAPRVNP